MKKRNPLTQKALDDWSYSLNEPTEEDAALQQWKEDLRQVEIKDRAKKVKEILSNMNLSERQLQIFWLFIDLGELKPVAKKLGISKQRVSEVVVKIRKAVLSSFKSLTVLV